MALECSLWTQAQTTPNSISTSKNGTADNFVTYGKSVFGLSVKHPQDWEVKGSDRQIRDGRTGYDQFATLCPKAILEYPVKEKGIPDYTKCPNEKEVVISVYYLPPNITLRESNIITSQVILHGF